MKTDKRFGEEFGTELPLAEHEWTILDLLVPGVVVVFVLALGAVIEHYVLGAAFWLLALSGVGVLSVIVIFLVIVVASASEMSEYDGNYPGS